MPYATVLLTAALVTPTFAQQQGNVTVTLAECSLAIANRNCEITIDADSPSSANGSL